MVMKRDAGQMDLTEVIRQRAKELWQKDGCKQGHDLDYWLKAEKMVKGSARR